MELLLTATQPKLKCMSILKSNLKASKAPNCHTCNELDGRSGTVLAIDKLSGRDVRHHSNILHILYMNLCKTYD